MDTLVINRAAKGDSDGSDQQVASPDSNMDVEILRTVPSGFAVDSPESANWLVRKIVAARQYREHVKSWAEQEARRAEREEETLMFLFGRQVETWAKDEIAKLSGRRKSLNLPAGCIGFRSVPARLVVDNEADVLDWARRSLPAAVVVLERLSRSALIEHCATTGEMPEHGTHVEAASERFFIR